MGTLYLLLTFSFATSVTATYFLIQILLLKPAKSDGAQTAVKAYVAVTGHIPIHMSASSATRLESGCAIGLVKASRFFPNTELSHSPKIQMEVVKAKNLSTGCNHKASKDGVRRTTFYRV